MLIPVFGPSSLPFITFYPGIMLTAWYGGLGPGALMTVLGAAAAVALWPVGAGGRVSAASIVSLALFLFNGAAISGLTELLHRARRRQDEFLRAEAAHQLEVESLLRSAQEARAAAEAANRAKDDFLAILSHELRTPIGVIIGWVSVLRRKRRDEVQLARAIDVIGRNAEIQARLVNDLLDVSRIVAGKLSLEKDEVDLAPLVRETVDAIGEDAAAGSLAVRVEVDPDAGLVLGDAVRLQQVVSNLVSNAVKFTSPGGRIDVRLMRHGPNARLVVADTGEGIAAEDLARIFERFGQGAALGNVRRAGLGLGLAICRHLVEAHGGFIRAESAGRGLGATFTVDLPTLAVRLRTGPGAEGRHGARPTARTALPSLEGFRILVVDDHDDTRETVGIILRHIGAHVRLAGSMSEALDLLSHAKVDVLVSDLGMPQGDGYELIRRVRAAERDAGVPAVPAVALTAYGSKEDRERALAAGFQAHVVKPVHPIELGTVIERVRASGT